MTALTSHIPGVSLISVLVFMNLMYEMSLYNLVLSSYIDGNKTITYLPSADKEIFNFPPSPLFQSKCLLAELSGTLPNPPLRES